MVLVALVAGGDGLEVGVGGVEAGELAAGVGQDLAAPGADLPGEVGLVHVWGFSIAEVETVLGKIILLQGFDLAGESLGLAGGLPLGQPLGLVEELGHEGLVAEGEGGERGFLAGEALGVFEGAAEDEPGDGVEVGGVGLAAEAHGLEGDRAAAGEGVVDLGGAAPDPADLVLEGLELVALGLDQVAFGFVGLAVAGGLGAQPAEDAARGGAFFAALVVADGVEGAADAPAESLTARLIAGVWEERGEQGRPAGGEGSAGGPDVEGRDVAVADVLLVDRVQGGLLEREGVLDEAGEIFHGGGGEVRV